MKSFWSKVTKTHTCWLWTGANNGKGYGRLYVGGKFVYPHRYSFKLHIGDIPTGMLVCHSCDVRNCVNPDHLFLGTSKDNTQDMISKGRLRSATKLSEHDVMRIRDLYASGTYSQAKLAQEYRCNQSQISRIVTSKRRKNVQV